jgi:hypothetical protein
MGVSKSGAELAQKMNLAADNIREARRASFRTAQRDMQPRFRDEARAAAGNNRRLSGAMRAGIMDADFKVVDGFTTTVMFVNPVGPWGLRDNTDASGGTRPHAISARNRTALQFFDAGGETVYRFTVWHPGSPRENFWGRARDFSFALIRTRIPVDTKDALASALNMSGFKSRT